MAKRPKVENRCRILHPELFEKGKQAILKFEAEAGGGRAQKARETDPTLRSMRSCWRRVISLWGLRARTCIFAQLNEILRASGRNRHIKWSMATLKVNAGHTIGLARYFHCLPSGRKPLLLQLQAS